MNKAETKMKKASINLLLAVAAAMLAEPGYHFATAKEADELLKGNLAEQNPDIADGDKLATRLTEAGQAEAAKYEVEGNGDAGDETAGSAATSSGGFDIDDGVPIPSARGGRGGSVYPFDDLGVGQSFFVPATAERPNPAKSLASTVSSATARFAEEIPGETVTNRKGNVVPKTRETRKFVVRSVDETKEGRGKGARVWRTA